FWRGLFARAARQRDHHAVLMKPVLITCGDPNGIGPEVILKTLADWSGAFPVVVGDPDHFDAAAAEIGVEFDPILIADGDITRKFDRSAMLPVKFKNSRQPGVFDPEHAPHIVDVLDRAISYALAGDAAAVVTAPINKAVLKEGCDYPFPGHTELLADRSGIERPVMMLAGPDLRVVPTTIHIPVSEVPSQLSPSLIADTIKITHDGLKSLFGIKAPRLVVAGLNPHAGEAGRIGTEEQDYIHQTVKDLAATGLDVTGPWPADTLFHAARRQDYDAAICMYHDQALIPIKAVNFDDAVNVTLGLPFLRTSPDHGTAFDIAGTEAARPDSFRAALKLATDYATRQ
ncbi:MAG: 4-hydroxythreonine-4-phosphate dehydrogenase PdxA, partial [Pseudomonadota bacterium]